MLQLFLGSTSDRKSAAWKSVPGKSNGTVNRHRRARGGLAAAAATTALLLAACGDDSGKQGFGSTTPETYAPPNTVSLQTTGSGPDAGELIADMEAAVQATDQFWTAHWSDFFTGTYSPPTVVGLYDGTQPGTPTCEGIPLEELNAFYCIPEDYVAWDVSLMALGFYYGDSWPYLVIAHEWGHAIANRLDASLQSRAYELQADCLAGATLYGSANDGVIRFEPNDEKEIVSALSQLGDDTPWTSSADHGDPFQRVESFNQGRTAGVMACLPTIS